jgi:Gly-Xaa carboxypeptidase
MTSKSPSRLPGGHSSVPPDHYGIISFLTLSQRLRRSLPRQTWLPSIVRQTTFPSSSNSDSPQHVLQPTNVEPNTAHPYTWLRKTIQKSASSKSVWKGVAEYLANDDIYKRYLMQTSQAGDLVNGGVKINALSEKVHAVINYRIAVESRTKDVRKKLQTLLEDRS